MKFSSLFLGLIITAAVAVGQEMPTNQFYIGYELERPNISALGVSLPRYSFNAVELSDSFRAYKWLGVETNFGVGYKQYQLPAAPTYDCVYFGSCSTPGSTNLNLFGLAGPRVQYSFGRLEPFGHFLLGAEHVRWDALNYSGNAFALGGGGGVVVHLTKHFGLAGGIDYIHAAKSINSITVGSNTVRFTAGPVFTWGGGRADSYISAHATNAPSYMTASSPMSAPSHTPAAPQTNGKPQTTAAVAAPLLGIVLDGRLRIIQLLPESTLPDHGIEIGDYVNSIDDSPVKSPEDLSAAMSAYTKGMKVKVGILTRGLWQSWVYVRL